MKYFVSAGILAVLALVVRFGAINRLGSFGIYILLHDRYYFISMRGVAFWLLLAIAAVWFLMGAYRLARPHS